MISIPKKGGKAEFGGLPFLRFDFPPAGSHGSTSVQVFCWSVLKV
jgi:hypothetical protein